MATKHERLNAFIDNVLPRLRGCQIKVAIAMVTKGDATTGWTEMDLASLAELSGYTARTVRRAIASLEQSGHLEVDRQQGMTSRYRVVT